MIDEEEYDESLDDGGLEDGEEGVIITLGDSQLIAMVSEEDRDLLAQSWTLRKAGSKDFPHYYAVHRWNINNTSGEDFLHTVVWERMMGETLPKGFLVDHINKDKLDNRRTNLRLARRGDNEANKNKRRTQKNSKTGQPASQYKGVHFSKNRKKCWRATITYEHKQIALGSYEDEKDAARAYNKAALEYYQEFASLNHIEGDETDA